MIQKNLASVPSTAVTTPGADKVAMQLLCGPADGCPNFAMRRFIVGPGGCTPKHQHDFEHEVLVLAGQGVAFGNDREQPLKAGDVFYVPAGEVHQFRNTGTGDLEFICMVPAFVHSGTSVWGTATPAAAGAKGDSGRAVDCTR